MSVQEKSRSQSNDSLWFKDSIIYELHVKTFFDSRNTGYGDFPGLTSKLDYLADLGIDTLWLLPFYPSPLRDDGYDISDYKNIHPNYGTMHDFKLFLKEAHKRNIKVITELAINHTSDQHPWFQSARKALPDSAKRNYYVWSDTDKKYDGTRIIFKDTEISNWTWDPVAKAYYWHRFFSHQPDLNYENERVRKAVMKVMRFWFDIGIDGMRLDAVPYLCERDGTSNENLPETHEIIKYLRSELDKNYNNRIFLAEANQWPEDVRHYFGKGDECHMAFHFPLMPRMFMALAMEDRYPIVEIMEQTPDIPENCQWGVFLRNHDELTLEMVSENERSYMYDAYARDKRARLNQGIRRRLAPLMENDRRKIELMHSMLFSMTGSPIIYYGDEIGMGDNLYLGDRNGVRTPMQWSPDRNAGFSAADPESLYLPPIMDPVYGYQSINVESQLRNSNSLLNWMKRIIAVRKRFKAFGRGLLTFIKPANRKILAFVRSYNNERILCVVNLSRFAQATHLNLPEYKGLLPVELMGKSIFPLITNQPYQLTLPGYGFFWFHLDEPKSHSIYNEEVTGISDKPTLIVPDGWNNLCQFSNKKEYIYLTSPRLKLETSILPEFLTSRRWFASSKRISEQLLLSDIGKISPSADCTFLLTKVEAGIEKPDHYFLPLSIEWEVHNPEKSQDLHRWTLGKVRKHSKFGYLTDALGSDVFCRFLLDGIKNNSEITFNENRLKFNRTFAFPPKLDTDSLKIHRPKIEQSNSSVMFGNQLIMKVFRKMQSGLNLEMEMGNFLTESSPFSNTAFLLGSIELECADGSKNTLAVLFNQIVNQGDGWVFTINYLERFLDENRSEKRQQHSADPVSVHNNYLPLIENLGLRIGQLHIALSESTGNAAFEPEKITEDDISKWKKVLISEGTELFTELKSKAMGFSKQLSDKVTLLLDLSENFAETVENMLPGTIESKKIRTHGDLHLGQVLLAKSDFYIIDFEGEPNRTVEEARAKLPAVRDVAGMLRSFSYAAHTALKKFIQDRPQDREHYFSLVKTWENYAGNAFLTAYNNIVNQSQKQLSGNQYEFSNLLRFFLIEKVIYEIKYEIGHRPDWIDVPLSGLLELLQETR
ncbi:MAG: maltose alpha-D-glucosyltransferase [Candidatus Riflebacteria bacterium]|nr:maltose alpha-D-glucosyltransferase [Candidatus Riflebacteria bacterium]